MATRFLHDNKVTASQAVISATSQQPGFPVVWIKDHLISKPWRSPVGWVVSAGFNDKIDFTEAGVARVGTIVASTYSTGTTMATAVQTAMNAAPGAVNTYTVTYDAGTKKFTIARATGAAAVVLKFMTGPNLASSVHIDLGFIGNDESGGTSYTGFEAVYQSRHAINVDLGASLTVRAGAAVVPSAGGTTYRLQGNTTTLVGAGAAAAVSYEADFTGGTISLQGATVLPQFFSQTRRYWRLRIDGRFNAIGYSEVFLWFVGDYKEPSVCVSNEFRKTFEQLSTVEYAKSGAHYQDRQGRRRAWSLNWLEITDADVAFLEAVEQLSPYGTGMYMTLDSTAPTSTTYYGFLRSGLEEVMVGGAYWNVPLTFAEALG